MKRFFFVFFLYFFLFVLPTYAVTTTITQHPSSITTSEPFTIAVSIEGASEGQNYVRIDLYKEGISEYFGETFNGTDWYGGSDELKFFPVTISSEKYWSGEVQGRIEIPPPQQYTGEGTYKMRVRRYTSSGNSASTDEMSKSAVDIQIVASSVPTETPTTTPSQTTIEPTKTPTPTPLPSPTPTQQPSFDHILISEAMVYPDGEDEWVKLYNDNDFGVSLTDWYLDDGENTGSSPKQFSLEIPAKGYAKVTIASAMFNNDGDTIRLLDHAQKEKDRITYEVAEKGKAVGRGNTANTPSPTPTTTPTPTQKPTITPTAIPSPTILPSPTSFISPAALNLFEETSDGKGTVLSTKTKNTESQEKKQELAQAILYVKGFSATSFSFSFCTMLYVLYKIKKKLSFYEKN